AAGIAGASPMRVAIEASRLGIVMYVIPFFFVYNPALILQGEWAGILLVVGTAVIGVIMIAAAMQGYLVGAGPLGGGALGWLARGRGAPAGGRRGGACRYTGRTARGSCSRLSSRSQ